MSVAVFETELEKKPNICLVTDMTTLLDETSVQAVTQVVEDNTAEKEGAALTLQEFLNLKAADIFCKHAAEDASQTNSKNTIDKKKLIVRMDFIDGATQAVVP